MELSDRVVVVLVEPQQPGNVGAAARAMANFGLSRLVLVDPPAYDPERARWMAPGCDAILANARVVRTLDEAFEGVHRVVATTARHRKQNVRIMDPSGFADMVLEDDRTTAVLFGREDFGLAAEAVARAEVLLRIPTPEHASLNLGQAVLVVAYSLFTAGLAAGAVQNPGRQVGGTRGRRTTRSLESREGPADVVAIEGAVEHLVQMLDQAGYPGLEKVGPTARGAFMRGAPTDTELRAMRGMIARIEKALPKKG